MNRQQLFMSVERLIFHRLILFFFIFIGIALSFVILVFRFEVMSTVSQNFGIITVVGVVLTFLWVSPLLINIFVYGNVHGIFTFLNAYYSPIGKIKGNWSRSRWEIMDPSGATIATLQLSSWKFEGKMETPFGLFTVKPPSSRSFSQLELYDSNDNLCFSVNKESFWTWSPFLIDSKGTLSPFLTCTASVCLIERFWTPRGTSFGGD